MVGSHVIERDDAKLDQQAHTHLKGGIAIAVVSSCCLEHQIVLARSSRPSAADRLQHKQRFSAQWLLGTGIALFCWQHSHLCFRTIKKDQRDAPESWTLVAVQV